MEELGSAVNRIFGAIEEPLATKLLRGAVAGLLGTAAMTPVIGLGAIGWGKPPSPAQITANVERKTGVDETPRDDPGFTPEWLAAHLTFGTSWGVAFALARPWLPSSNVAAGLLWGGAIWVINYGAVLPALGLYPRPSRDETWRELAMIAAHGVYGTMLAEAAAKLRE